MKPLFQQLVDRVMIALRTEESDHDDNPLAEVVDKGDGDAYVYFNWDEIEAVIGLTIIKFFEREIDKLAKEPSNLVRLKIDGIDADGRAVSVQAATGHYSLRNPNQGHWVLVKGDVIDLENPAVRRYRIEVL